MISAYNVSSSLVTTSIHSLKRVGALIFPMRVFCAVLVRYLPHPCFSKKCRICGLYSQVHAFPSLHFCRGAGGNAQATFFMDIQRNCTELWGPPVRMYLYHWKQRISKLVTSFRVWHLILDGTGKKTWRSLARSLRVDCFCPKAHSNGFDCFPVTHVTYINRREKNGRGKLISSLIFGKHWRYPSRLVLRS